MQKDYYLYLPADQYVIGHSLTLEEAQELQREIERDCPDEAGETVICKASDDYKLASERAFTHMALW